MKEEDAVVDSLMQCCTRGGANMNHLLHKQLKNGNKVRKWG